MNKGEITHTLIDGIFDLLEEGRARFAPARDHFRRAQGEILLGLQALLDEALKDLEEDPSPGLKQIQLTD
ncbi:MAG: hypothetical protein ACOYD6_02405 [Limnochordia bacterium]|jgi:hypothetical protein